MDAIENALMGAEVGYEEIGYDEMGRRILRPRRGGRASHNPNLPSGTQHQADRLYPFPVISAAAIAAAGTGNATGRPQATCKPVRFVVHTVYDTAAPPAAVASAAWLINSIQIGQRLQSIAAGGETGDMFAFNAVATGIEFDTAVQGQDVFVNATDMGGITAGKTAIFRSTFLCKALHY
jgi:hypothetical protein